MLFASREEAHAMKTKLLLKIAAAIGAFVLVGGISVAALARSGAGSSTPPSLPVVSTPGLENDDTETPDRPETESPEADDQGEDADDQGEDADDQGENEDADDQGENEDADDQGENEDADDQGENEDDQGEDADDQGENEDGDD
jgi:hypothetical protein